MLRKVVVGVTVWVWVFGCASVPAALSIDDQPPVLEPISNQRVDEGRALRVTLRASDPDNDPLEITASPLPDGAALENRHDGSWAFTWTPRVDQSGTYQITFKASEQFPEEEGPLSTEKAATITVRETTLAVSGRIRNAMTKAGLDGVTVRINTASETVAEVKTDARGFYLVAGIRPGAYKVKPQYEPHETFSTAARKRKLFIFTPFIHKVTIVDHDAVHVDFTGSPS